MIEIVTKKDWIRRAREYSEVAKMPSMKSGKLAEYAVIDYFKSQGIPLKEDQTPKDRPDYFDINLGSTLVDVKSCLEPAKELRITKNLFDKGRRFAFYIGVQITRDYSLARIYGFCTKDDVTKARVRLVGKRECYVIKFHKLRPIELIVESFSKKI